MNPFAWYRARTHIPGRREHRSNFPWKYPGDPKRILIIRFHAIGDVALSLPACLGLRRRYPDARIDFLTSEEAAPLLRAINLCDSVLLVQQSATRIAELNSLVSMSQRLRHERYQVVLDLQRNWKSRWIRRAIKPESWGEFDRFSPSPASDRTLGVFHDAGFHSLLPVFDHQLTQEALESAEDLLRSQGWRPGDQLVLFNPAGLWESRHWPLENYVGIAQAWPGASAVRFVLVGTGRLRAASRFLAGRLGNRLIDLTENTSLDVAFALLRFVDIVITEDSGLMHMAWSLGIPLVALFGSSRHYWSLPTGEHVRAFHSGDLPCGACMQPQCKYGDNHCLTRVTPGVVLHAVEELLRTHDREQHKE